MRNSTQIRVVTVAAAAVGMLGAPAAFAGGNGNGGNGSGGAHGAATSGMTYHSEPVSSPWNRPYGDALKITRKTDPDATVMTQGRERSRQKWCGDRTAMTRVSQIAQSSDRDARLPRVGGQGSKKRSAHDRLAKHEGHAFFRV
jgi:hypothetical protein